MTSHAALALRGDAARTAIEDAAATVHRAADFLARGFNLSPSRVLGNGLRELDALFGTFLEAVSHGLSFSATPSPYRDSYVRGSSIRQTHTASRLRRILSGMGLASPHIAALRSLRKMSNCLVFHAGKITASHTGGDAALIVRWLGAAAAPSSTPIPRERTFASGELLRLSPLELTEICWSYCYLTDEMVRILAQRDDRVTPPR